MSYGDPSPVHDPYLALRIPSVRLYLGGSLIASMGFLMKDAAILWEVYDRTGSYAQLGFVGVLQAAPVIALPLVTGHVADRFSRKRIMSISLLLLAATAVVLAINSRWIGSMGVLYGALGFHGAVRAFQQPARQSLLPQICTPEAFPNAVTWGTGAFHVAQMLGPIIAGFILAVMRNAWLVYLIYAVLALVFFVMLFWVEHRPSKQNHEAITIETVTSGLTFVFRSKLLLMAMSIDLFAVLLGGATGLMPVFQKDILQVGATWYGVLRAAPAMGAVVVSIWIAHRPPFNRAGRAMILAVAGYAVATIVFGISEILWLTILALFLSGACDIVSVVIRHTMIQVLTPDSMRGRVSAINGMFIGASNYLGDAEAGYVAEVASDLTGDRLLGTKISVVSGGLGSLLVVLAAAALSPEFRKYGRIGVVAAEPEGRAVV